MSLKGITPHNENGQRHGYWKYHYGNGSKIYKGNFINDKPHGLWIIYFSNNNLADKIYYLI